MININKAIARIYQYSTVQYIIIVDTNFRQSQFLQLIIQGVIPALSIAPFNIKFVIN